MKKLFLSIFILFCLVNSFPADHGIYLLTNNNIQADFSQVVFDVKVAIENAGFQIIAERDMATPDGVSEDGQDSCGFSGKLLMFKSDDYNMILTSFGNKYLAVAFLKIGIYETDNGVMINMADLETINRIAFNDMDDETYQKAVGETLPFKKKIVDAMHSLKYGDKVEEAMDPKRDTEALRGGDRDMFMMVGRMTS